MAIQKLTSRAMKALAESDISADIYDSEIPGFHVRKGKRGWVFRLGYTNLAGKNNTLTLGRYGLISASAARAAALDAIAIIRTGGDPRALIREKKSEAKKNAEQTLLAYLDGDYADHQRRKKDGENTLSRIRRDFKPWLKKSMSDLSRSDVEKWQAEQEAKADPKAFETLKRSYGALQTLLNHAAGRVIAENPLKGVLLQRPALDEEELSEKGSERRNLEPVEVRGFFAGLDAYQSEKKTQRRSSRAHGKPWLADLDSMAYVDHVKPFLLMMYYSGFRPGDIFGLRWEHLDLERKTIRKTIEKTAHHHPEARTFPICTALVEVLADWKENTGRSGGLVFPSPVNGRRMSGSAMRKPWVKVKKLGGLDEGLAMYTLRHNFASQLVMQGVDLLTVSQLMGHSDIQTTIKFYGHLAPDHKRGAVELFATETDKLNETG